MVVVWLGVWLGECYTTTFAEAVPRVRPSSHPSHQQLFNLSANATGATTPPTYACEQRALRGSCELLGRLASARPSETGLLGHNERGFPPIACRGAALPTWFDPAQGDGCNRVVLVLGWQQLP